MTIKKKLIEVALPLDAINFASAREKSIRHGHPSTLHLWWARRPIAAARAVIFAQMVDDPSSNPDLFPTEKAQADERARLFRIIEDLVLWENTTNETVIQAARDEIWHSWRRTCDANVDHPEAKGLFDRDVLPAFHDPFAGGGALPLEAQRLGLESFASDLNPVSVLINKAMIEIPPKFAGNPPVNPKALQEKSLINREWIGANGLAEDVRQYGAWMRDEAKKRIGHLYPDVKINAEMAVNRPDLKSYVGQSLTVIAWIWVRTVKSPNPAFSQRDVPLASTYLLSSKSGNEAYVEPNIENGDYAFNVKTGKPKDPDAVRKGTKISRGANFSCILSGTPISSDYVKAESHAGRMGERLMAIVVEGQRGRVYLSPTPEHEAIALTAIPEWRPELTISGSTQYIGVKPYGIEKFDQLFTDRQLVALTTFSDLVEEVTEQIRIDGLSAGMKENPLALSEGGVGAAAYAEAVSVYLAFGVSRLVNRLATVCIWNRIGQKIEQVFRLQAIQMTWDFPETNVFSNSSGGWDGSIGWIPTSIERFPNQLQGTATQSNASSQSISAGKIVSTDPPYYDNVPYSDLSDFFYVWLRRSVQRIFPDMFATLSVPKTEELVAFAYRHENKVGAEAFFLEGMTEAMSRIAEQSHPEFPITIFYAFKQSETKSESGTVSTGWETFLDAVMRAGFVITGTWPIKTERAGGVRNLGRNSLSSSIVLTCRKRESSAVAVTRGEFILILKTELPMALLNLQRVNIAPVDLAQAAIGPGMSVYSRYDSVIDAEGNPLPVREALALINRTLDEVLTEQEGDFEPETRFALQWFTDNGFENGSFGDAHTYFLRFATAENALHQAGIISSGVGVRLLKASELSDNWDPESDARFTAWQAVHQLVKALESGAETAAAALVNKLGSKAETARELAYRLYVISERKKRYPNALSYNSLVQSWPEITRLAREDAGFRVDQASMFEDTEV
jgi:putative DNA methylase